MSETVLEKIRAAHAALTRAERQLADVICANYPVSGLGSITQLAEAAGVSTPTLARMVQKLGYAGFAEFQGALRDELAAQISNPIAKHDSWTRSGPQGHILNRFADQVLSNVRQTLGQIDPDVFDRVVALLGDPGRAVYITGGRITHALSEYLYLHMQVVRRGVQHIRSTSNAWPHGLLDLAPDDVLVIYDIRRYENNTLRLAEMAKGQGARIVLLTDQWQSPVRAHADYCFSCRIEAPSAWDSTITLMLLSETLIAAVQEAGWEDTRERMRRLEATFDATRIFRKFV